MMTIDKQKVRTRLEAKRTELQYEIAEIAFEEAFSVKQIKEWRIREKPHRLFKKSNWMSQFSRTSGICSLT